MGLSCDTASAVLLCAEDSNSILCFEDEVEEGVRGLAHEGGFLMGFPLQTDDVLESMVKREAEHLPREDYAERLVTGALDVAVRTNAVDWICKAHAHCGFGPLSSYLAVNYLDRFLSAYQLPPGKDWMTQLLSVACLSLAAKMEEAEVPLVLDLQVGESKYVFESRTIQRMELLVLSTLKWRMQAVTPFSFIDYFLHKLNDGNDPSMALVSKAAQLILSTARGVEFLAFRPSEIAAAVAMSALGETQVVEIDRDVDCCNHVDKERVFRCYEAMQEVILMRGGPMKITSPSISVPQSPNGVLDAACISYQSDETRTVVGSHAASHHCSSPASKRRKVCRQSVL